MQPKRTFIDLNSDNDEDDDDDDDDEGRNKGKAPLSQPPQRKKRKFGEDSSSDDDDDDDDNAINAGGKDNGDYGTAGGNFGGNETSRMFSGKSMCNYARTGVRVTGPSIK